MNRAINIDLLGQLIQRLSRAHTALDSLSLCEHDYRSFSEFVDIFPDNAPGNTGKILYKLLIELNTLNVLPHEKLRMLNKIRPATLQCAHQLSRAQLTIATAKAFSLSQALLKHLSMGYRTVVAELCNSFSDNSSMPQLSHALHHALETQGLLQLKSLQFYLQLPSNFWQDLHSLYRIASVCHLTNTPNPSHAKGSEPSATIHCEYVRSLLLNCCNPNHLSNADLVCTYNALLTWSKQVLLVTGHNPSLFIVDLDSNKPPQFASQAKLSKHYQMRIFIDRLTATLQQQLADQPSASNIKGVPFRLIKTLRKAWSSEPTRQHERSVNTNTIDVIYGISFIHQVLTGLNFDDYLDKMESLAPTLQRDPDSMQQGHNRQESRGDEVWPNSHTSAGGPKVPLLPENLNQDKIENQQTIVVSEPLRAGLVDMSKSGICLEFSGKKLPKIPPGEVILVMNANGDSRQLGIVRWKRTTNKLTNLLGIELISKHPTARAARVFKPGQHSPYLPALQLFTDVQSDSPQLITPIMPFKIGDQIHLLGGKNGLRARLCQELDSTSLISRFEISASSY